MRKLLIIGLLFLAGCSALKQDQKHLAQIQVRNPQLIADNCAVLYPPKTETKYQPGKETHTSDTVVIEGKRIPCPPVVVNKDTVINWVDCPPSKVIHDTIRRTDTVFIQVENTARVKSLELQNANITADRDNWQAKAEKRGKWNLYLGGFILLLGVGAFVKLKFF